MPKKIALAPFASFPLLTSLTRSQSVSHCLWSQSRVECGLISRNGHQGSSFDPLTFYLARIPHQGGALLDSEIACVDASGRPPFDDLPFRRREPRLFAFDLLHLNGKDCRRDCLARRKVALKHVLKVRPSGVTYVGHVEVEGKALYARVCDLDPEGIVAKHKDSPYLTLLNERFVQESKQHSVDLKTL